MVFIRSKIVKGESYSYLVKSNWNSKKKTSQQETIKYLGRTSDISLQDIPAKYRDSPSVLSYLASNQEFSHIKHEEYLETTRQTILEHLLEGDLESVFSVYGKSLKFFKTGDFFDEILRPVMYEVGNLWKSEKLDVGSEHVATNMAMHLIEDIMPKTKSLHKGKSILICTPYGEHHLLPCLMMEALLSQIGYGVVNLAPSVPTESVITHVTQNRPDLILISITLSDNINSAKRLVSSLSKLKIPVLIGGQAIQSGEKLGNAKVLGSPTMKELTRIIKNEAS